MRKRGAKKIRDNMRSAIELESWNSNFSCVLSSISNARALCSYTARVTRVSRYRDVKKKKKKKYWRKCPPKCFFFPASAVSREPGCIIETATCIRSFHGAATSGKAFSSSDWFTKWQKALLTTLAALLAVGRRRCSRPMQQPGLLLPRFSQVSLP